MGTFLKLNANTEGSQSNLNYFCFFFYFFTFLAAKIYDEAEEPLDDPASLNGNASLLEMSFYSPFTFPLLFTFSLALTITLFSVLNPGSERLLLLTRLLC